tara:strand:- start:503 stop:1747 length:1245 start_codon:yes stop_codon:yes gene_type:complete
MEDEKFKEVPEYIDAEVTEEEREKIRQEIDVPEEFNKIMKEFLNDLLLTFPEYKDMMTVNEEELLEGKESKELYFYCSQVYPGRFFDILYKNEKIFNDDKIDTKFLPNVDFQYFFNEDITDNTKDTIWKYLQLILFCISKNLTEAESFGETAKLFEAINEDEFKSKLEETINDMSNLFDVSGIDLSGIDLSGIDLSGIDMSSNMPNPNEINDHISSLLNGKLGQLASEIAEETANEMDLNVNENANVNTIFEKLFKNPGKLMGMIKKVGSKLDEKIKSGEIKESELMQEASDLMKKMKSIPGVKNMDQLFKQMGMPGMHNMGGLGKQKINMNAMQSNLNQRMKQSKQRERMLAKLKKRKEERERREKQNYVHTTFQGDEKMQKSSRTQVVEEGVSGKKKKKKRKKKKKKGGNKS